MKIFLFFLTLFFITSCGQSGRLYLPNQYNPDLSAQASSSCGGETAS